MLKAGVSCYLALWQVVECEKGVLAEADCLFAPTGANHHYHPTFSYNNNNKLGDMIDHDHDDEG